ncbi:hypothetical protein FKW77_001540 [Venturia effusa]|uniref:Major facilitator superfamily (MFS) profile domain-containing protein n=1 Tax=Venturia effusa TaxID=50376 RepID=A0A517LGK0_9PEZI|nr:hypothetical protein FKW77_001540 [Venturia effusa]
MAAEVPRRRRWSSIFNLSSSQRPKDVNTRISLPCLDLTDSFQLRNVSLSSDTAKHELNKEDSDSTMVQSDATPSSDCTFAVKKDEHDSIDEYRQSPVDEISLTPVRHARDKSLASSFRFGGDEIDVVRSSNVPPIPALPPRIAPLFSRNPSIFSTPSSAPSLRRPPRFDPRGFCRPDDSLRAWRPHHLPHFSTGSSLYSTDTALWSQLPTFEERYPHIQRPHLSVQRAPWPPIHPLAQSYENIISPMLLNYIGQPTLASIVDSADDSPMSEVAAIENRFSSRDMYLDQRERWESLYHGEFGPDHAQSDCQSDARSEYRSDTEGELPANDTQLPVPDLPLTSKEQEDEPPESYSHNECRPLRLGIILFSLWFGNLLVALQDSMIPIAIPTISSELHELNDIAEYLSWYLLAFTVAYPISHKLCRLFDPRVVYLFAVVFFAVGNGFCGSATTSKYLIWCRTIAGIGGASLLQGSTSIIECIIRASEDNSSLTDYIKFVESAYAFSLALGPVLGGLIVDHLGWRWCFWILGISSACLFSLVAVSFRNCPTHQVRCKRSFFARLRSVDYLGVISFSGAMFSLLLALNWAGLEHSWTSATTLGLLFAFVLLLSLLVFVEWVQEDRAMLPPMTLRRDVFWSSLCLLCAYGTSAMLSLYIPFYFQVGQATSATISGIRNLPLVLPSIAAIVLAVGTSFRGRHCVPYMLVGQIVTALGLTFFSIQGASNDTGVWLVLLSIVGFGLAITTLLPYFMLGEIFESRDRHQGHVIMTFFSRLGGTIIASVCQSVFIEVLLKQFETSASPTTLAEVTRVGATRLEKLALKADELVFVREAFSIAISKIMYTGLAVTMMGMLFILALCMSMFGLKRHRDGERI